MSVPVPKVGQTYTCYDDGKITESRRFEVTIEKVVTPDKVDKEILDQWKADKKECDWLYADKTDYFIFSEPFEDEEQQVFVRTVYGKWFSLGFWASLLIVE